MSIETESVSQQQINSLQRALGMGAILIPWSEVDLTRGRGVLEGSDRCLWTKEGHRITIGLITGGGLMASIGQDPDPEAPPAGGYSNE